MSRASHTKADGQAAVWAVSPHFATILQVKEKKTSAVGPVLLGFFLFVVVGSGVAQDRQPLTCKIQLHSLYGPHADVSVLHAALLQIIRTATSGSMF